MGFGGIENSLAIAFDTWQNPVRFYRLNTLIEQYSELIWLTIGTGHDIHGSCQHSIERNTAQWRIGSGLVGRSAAAYAGRRKCPSCSYHLLRRLAASISRQAGGIRLSDTIPEGQRRTEARGHSGGLLGRRSGHWNAFASFADQPFSSSQHACW